MIIKSSDSVGAFFSVYLWLKEGKYEENKAFLCDLGVPEGRQIYVSALTSTVIALLSEKELERATGDKRLLDWSPYSLDIPQKASDEIILEQIGATVTNAMGYSGKGVKIGVISAEGLTYDKNAPGLRDARIIDLPTVVPPRVDPHPTAVLSQIVGQRVTIDGRELFGVVRDATVYFASTRTKANVYRAIENMIAEGVRIINYSAGIFSGGYSDFDRQLDKLIGESDFLFVTVSGNQRAMSSPGRAENAVAVGNAVTKSYPDTALPPPWAVWCVSEDDCSGYSEDGVHKPDLVAPGTWVGYGVSDDEISFDSFGTSFACPWVSGVAAAVLEALGDGYSYLTLKGILLLSCNRKDVSPSGDPLVGDYIRLRSGWGFLDGARALQTAREGIIYEGCESGDYSVNSGEYDIMAVFEGRGTVKFNGEEYPSGEENTLLIRKRSETPLSLSVVADSRYSLILMKP